MTEANPNQFFTANHKRLTDIAKLADILAWIVLVIYLVLFVSSLTKIPDSLQTQNLAIGNKPYALEIFTQKPLIGLSLIIGPLTILVQGLIFWLIPRGISLGLNMIVETDLNYRGQSQGEDDE